MAMATLTGDNILVHMRLMAELKEQKFKHFHYDCKLWKAIYDAVAMGSDLVEHPDDYLIMSYRGSGRAVRLVEVYIYAKDYTVDPPQESPVIGMEIEIEYTHEDNDGYDHPETVTKKLTLQPPTELLTDFDAAQFKKWVRKVKKKRKTETEEKDMAEMVRLRKKHGAKAEHWVRNV